MWKSGWGIVFVAGALAANVSVAEVKIERDPARGKVISIEKKAAAPTRRTARPMSLSAPADHTAQAAGYLETYGGSFGVKNPSGELSVKDVSSDPLGMTHVRYQQVYKGVPVLGGELVVHVAADASFRSINGKFIENISLDVQPGLSEGDGLTAAGRYWDEQFKLPYQIGDVKLWVINPKTLQDEDGESYLAWEVQLNNFANGLHNSLFIDAHTGELRYLAQNSRNAIEREVWDYIYGEWNYLLDQYDARYDYTFGRSEGQPARGTNPTTGGRVDIVYDRLKQMHRFVGDVFDRDGANGMGGTGEGVAVPYNISRGKLDEGVCQPPRGGGGGYYQGTVYMCSALGEVINIMGHEYGHAMLEGRLLYSSQSGSLEEGIVAAIGEGFELYLTGRADWIDTYRNYTDPHTPLFSVRYPDNFYDGNMQCSGSDYGGVHRNMTIPGHAAYLMSKGGEKNGCSIHAIGIDRTLQIWYRAAMNYFVYTNSFNAAKVYLLQACSDLYPAAICYQVDKALRAVKMDQPGLCADPTRAQEQAPACDLCPSDDNKTDPGCNGCGAADTDSDNDGTPDCYDECSADPAKVMAGRCGCGVVEVIEDADRDGFFGPGSCPVVVDDCDDGPNGYAINPDATEVCDGVDNNCNGKVDDGLNPDADGDGHYGAGSCSTAPIDDCNDNDAAVYEGAAELCDGKDNDCDGTADDGLTFDADGDGYSTAGSCGGTKNDCNDADQGINPGAVEICGNGVDEDCSGSDLSCPASCADTDGGIVPNTYGEVTWSGMIYKDTCLSAKFVTENYCSGGRRVYASKFCAAGCAAGACR